MSLNDFIHEVYEVIEKPSQIIELLINVIGLMNNSYRTLKYRPPGLYEILDYDELYTFGDFHGDFDTLIDMLGKNKILDRIYTSDLKLVFLGDYIDRGEEQIELITAVLLLKKMFPDKIILLRGNHEPSPLLIPHPHDFPETLYMKYGGEAANELYRWFLLLFYRLPFLARIPGKILFLHGGPVSRILYSKSFEEAFGIGLPCPDDYVIEEVLWNDPVNDMSVEYTSSPRGAGILFSEKITIKTLELANVKYIVRGHEAVDGYKFDHRGLLVTLFDARKPYGLSRAGYLYIRRSDELVSINEYIHTI